LVLVSSVCCWPFGRYSVVAPGDFDGDGRPDLIGRKPNGELYLYSGTGAAPWFAAHGVLIRGGFSGYNTIVTPGDFTGDGHPDLIARTPSGDLYLYSGTGTGGLSASAPKIGYSFDTYPLLFSTGDFSGDGHPDLIGVKSSGELVIYRGSGLGGWSSGRGLQIGTGWQRFSMIF
jgi:hypothetical protein